MKDTNNNDNKPLNQQQIAAIGFYLEGARHVLSLIAEGILPAEIQNRMEGLALMLIRDRSNSRHDLN